MKHKLILFHKITMHEKIKCKHKADSYLQVVTQMSLLIQLQRAEIEMHKFECVQPLSKITACITLKSQETNMCVQLRSVRSVCCTELLGCSHFTIRCVVQDAWTCRVCDPSEVNWLT